MSRRNSSSQNLYHEHQASHLSAAKPSNGTVIQLQSTRSPSESSSTKLRLTEPKQQQQYAPCTPQKNAKDTSPFQVTFSEAKPRLDSSTVNGRRNSGQQELVQTHQHSGQRSGASTPVKSGQKQSENRLRAVSQSAMTLKNRNIGLDYKEMYKEHSQTRQPENQWDIKSNRSNESTHDRIFGSTTPQQNLRNNPMLNTEKNKTTNNWEAQQGSTKALSIKSKQNSQQSDLDNQERRSQRSFASRSVSECSSAMSYVQQLVCNNCVNRETAEENAQRKKREKEAEIKQMRESYEANQRLAADRNRRNAEGDLVKKNEWARHIQEEARMKAEGKIKEKMDERNRVEKEREMQQTAIEQLQIASHEAQQQKTKLYVEELKRQIEEKQSKQESMKSSNDPLKKMYEEQQRFAAIDAQRRLEAKMQKEQQIWRTVQQQIEDKRAAEKVQQQKDREIERSRELAMRESEIKQRERLDEIKMEKIKTYKEYFAMQQTAKDQQKLKKVEENNKIQQMFSSMQEQSRHQNYQSLERERAVRKEFSQSIQAQLDKKQMDKLAIQAENAAYNEQMKKLLYIDVDHQRSLLKNCDHCSSLYPESYLTQRILKTKSKSKSKRN